MPLDFHFDSQEFHAELRQGLHTWPMGSFRAVGRLDFYINTVVFLPMGLLLAAGCRAKSRWGYAVPFVAAGLAGGVSLAVEAGQLFLTDRNSCLSDLTINTLSGFASGLIGMIVLHTPVRRLASLAARKLRARHGWFGAAVIVLAMLFAAFWPFKLHPMLARAQWEGTIWDIQAGLARHPWHVWLVEYVLAYGVLTLLLAGLRGPAKGLWLRAGVSAIVAGLLAVSLQTTHLVMHGPPPIAAEPLVAFLSACLAAMLAPLLRSDRASLPSVILACMVGLVGLAGYLTWEVHGAAYGGFSRLPLWTLYARENIGEGFRAVFRWGIIGGLSFLLAFYWSLRTRWLLRRRMLAGLAGATLCALLMEIGRLIIRPGRVDWAGLGEQILAAIAGAILFALLWRLLNRRLPAAPTIQYPGPDRRGNREKDRTQ